MEFKELGYGPIASEMTALGQWTISPDRDHQMAKIKFIPNLGKDRNQLREEYQALEKTIKARGEDPLDFPEYWLAYSAPFAQHEIMSFESQYEARHIVEFIENLPETIPSWRTTLDQMGFEQAYDPIKEPKLAGVYHLKSNTKFSLSIDSDPEQGMWLRYEPNGPRWYNLAILQAVHWNHDKTTLIPQWWPQKYDPVDLMALIVERIIRIRTTQKQHIRFKPTEPITHVEPV